MSLVVVLLLIGLWAWVLLPGLLRGRRASSPLDTVDQFERSMDTLAQASPEAPGRHVLVRDDAAPVVMGVARTAAALRRRSLLARGGFAVAIAAITGVLFGGWWWIVLGAVSLPYAIYVVLAVRLERRLAERQRTIRDLKAEREQRQPRTVASDPVVELVVGDESGIIITGWKDNKSPEP